MTTRMLVVTAGGKPHGLLVSLPAPVRWVSRGGYWSMPHDPDTGVALVDYRADDVVRDLRARAPKIRVLLLVPPVFTAIAEATGPGRCRVEGYLSWPDLPPPQHTPPPLAPPEPAEPVGLDIRAARAGLSEQQLRALELAAQGLTDTRIGQEMGTTAGTVKQHLRRAYRRLDVQSRPAAILLLLRRGVLQ